VGAKTRAARRGAALRLFAEATEGNEVGKK